MIVVLVSYQEAAPRSLCLNYIRDNTAWHAFATCILFMMAETTTKKFDYHRVHTGLKRFTTPEKWTLTVSLGRDCMRAVVWVGQVASLQE